MSGPTGATHPALGSGVWGVLLRTEWFKVRKRRAFWVTFGFFSFITFMQFGEDFIDARRDSEASFTLQEVWPQVFSGDSVIFLIFGSIALIMMASSEFTWRTARQNVIDGLSKSQWFWGKTMLLPILGLAFLAAKVGIPGVMAAMGTDFGGAASAATGSALPLSVVQAAGALLLAFLSLGSLALLLSLTIRASGPAIAVWFFWIVFGEQLTPGLLGRFFPSLGAALAFLPFSTAQQLLGFAAFDAPTHARAVAAAEAAGETAPSLPDVGMAVYVSTLWTVLFLAVAFLWFRRKDL